MNPPARQTQSGAQDLAPGATLLHGFALQDESPLLAGVDTVIAAAPLRHMVTPGGFAMSVAMTNCGPLGWVTDRRGYRYESVDPGTGQPWPPMPVAFQHLARAAADRAGFPGFTPDVCLINRYAPKARLSLHQDKDERDFSAPIVSVSLGLPAVFLFGGPRRADKAMRIPMAHGDVAVWGGPARRNYHGIAPLKDGWHPVLGACRINLTLRKAG